MMIFVRSGHTFSYRSRLDPACSDGPHLPATKLASTAGEPLVTKRIFRPIPPNAKTTKDWTAIAWPTNIQSKTPDGKFGPAKQMEGWNDCWFLASLAAVANDSEGHKILAESIQKVNGGYDVTFKGLPNNKIFVSDSELDNCLEEKNTFTYSEPINPTVVHTGALSHLIQAILSRNVYLAALEPTIGQNEAESSHAGEQRGRHLLTIHQQAVRDGKIDPAESGPLANLMETDDGAFRQLYDSDKNGVIEGGELQAVQLRVDRWADYFKLTPIW